jgi:cellulose synthase/poly-beta-1,6-N-acetylglucosamine synthase-like glycosyltransferase
MFVLVSLTVLYLGFFAFTSMLVRHSETPKAKFQNRFIILIISQKNGKSVLQTVNSILGQTYPQRLFDVTVIAEQEDEITMFHLAQQPVTLITPNFEKSSRTKSLQLAVNNLPQFKIYDTVIILDAGDIVEPEFLEQMNDAYESAGTKAIQAHKVSFNRDSVSARLSSVFEEINNSIFRRGHISVGLSAAMASSGMVFNFEWFKQQILRTKINWADKELEALLMRHHIYVDYFDNIMVYGEKSRHAEDFNREHRRWAFTQWQAVLRNLHHLPAALIHRHYDMIDKLLQWMLMPRIVMMVIIMTMCAVLPFIYFSMAIKWWILFAIVLFIFAMATPNYLVDDKWDSTFYKVPVVLMSPILSKCAWGRKFIEFINLKH